MEQKTPLEFLERIDRVAVPTDLYQRIEHRIAAQNSNRIARKWPALAAAAFALLISANVYVASLSSSSTDDDIETIADAFNITNDQYFYYE